MLKCLKVNLSNTFKYHWCNGSITAFQAAGVGSNPIWYCFYNRKDSGYEIYKETNDCIGLSDLGGVRYRNTVGYHAR